MSFVKARQRTEVAAPTSEHSNKCAANGCPLNGSISANGNRYVCCFHHTAEGHQWPGVTEAMLQNEKILMALSEVVRMGDMDWVLGKWELMQRYFEGESELQPTVAERNHRRWYEYRLNGWMMYLAGISKKKPVPREPLVYKKTKGNLGNLLGSA
jgi:hypothetical protein